MSFVLGIVSSYLLNKHGPFRPVQKRRQKEITRFVFISLIGFSLNIGLDYVFVNMVGSFWNMKPILWAQFSAVMAGAITMSWNFLGYKFIVFKVKAAPTPSPDRTAGRSGPDQSVGKKLILSPTLDN